MTARSLVRAFEEEKPIAWFCRNLPRNKELERRAVKSEEVRFVWLFVFFDLPVGTKADRRWAIRFRTCLKDDGFLMLHLSMYARVCRGEDAADKHAQRVTKNLSPTANKRV
jgi:CRISPR-associated endonuclease Cas2